MPIVATPELGIPFPFDTTPEELDEFRDKARAYFATVQVLMNEGMGVDITQEDKVASHRIMTESKMPPTKTLTPGTIVNLEAILCEWDQEVLDVSRRLRNYVTNKLIMESTDSDPKQRIKALELLGKVSSVGLYSDRIDISVTSRSVTDIETELRKTLELYGGNVIDVTNSADDLLPSSIEEINLDEEFGGEVAQQGDDGP
tara:strand:+ start:92 stop:694 length:603 start_codon:yes stop_codon:yes gene_type:complete